MTQIKVSPRPLVPIAVAFIIGIILADAKVIPENLAFIFLLGFGLTWTILYLVNRFSILRVILICVLCLLAGLFRLYGFNKLPENHIAHFNAEHVPIRLIGVVNNDPVIIEESNKAVEKDEFSDNRREQTKGWFVISSERISAKDETNQVSGLIRVSFSDFIPDVKYGDRVEILGLIYSPRPPTNPGQFDYSQYLKRQGIYKSISVVKPEDIQVIETNKGNPVMAFIQGIRRNLIERIKLDFPHDQQGFLSALLLGNRAAIPDEIEDSFLHTGTIHILSVSGLHVVMVLAIFVWLMGLFGIKDRSRAVILILITISYMLLTGLSTPIVRAGVMSLVYFGAELFRRKSNSINTLAFAALIILVANPNELFSIGFQLSFISVLSIIIFFPEIRKIFPREEQALMAILPKTFPEKVWDKVKWYLFSAVAVSLAALAGSAILVSQTFHIITPVVLLANLVLGLLVFIILPVGLIYLVLSTIGIPLIFTCLLSFLVKLTLGAISLFAKIPFAYFYLPDIPLWIVLVYYGVFCLWYVKPYLSINNKYIIGLSGGAISAVIIWCIISLIPIQLNKPDSMTLTMIDVGEGASFFMEFPDGKNCLYDAGNQSRFDAGKNTIAPFLWSKGITRIDKLILSHPHLDHINGVPALLERFRVGEVLINEWFGQYSSGKQLSVLIQKKGISVREVKRGDEISLAKGISGTVLGPLTWDELLKEDKGFKENDTSMVLQIKYQNKALLLTGDIESSGIGWLLESEKVITQCEVMQIPHHGNWDPKVVELLDAVEPCYVLINAKETDVSEEIIQACKEKGIKVFASYGHGVVIVNFGKTEMTSKSYK